MDKQDLSRLGIPPANIRNHFGIAAETDYFLRAPNRTVPHWSETGAFIAYNPDENVAVFTHVGRCQQDLDLWWSHSLVFLPNGEIFADRSFGRTGDDNPHGVSAGSSRIYIDEPFKRWRSVFDGHGERTSMQRMAQGICGHGPGVAMRYEVSGEALGPFWDLATDNSGTAPAGDWGHVHYEQNFRTQGKLSIEGKEYSLDGIGWNDHSRGPRTFSGYGTHRWVSAILPGAVIHAIAAWGPDGKQQMAVGSMFFADGSRESVSVNFPGHTDTMGGPLDFDVELTRKKDGSIFKLHVETIYPLVLSITGKNDNLNGLYWEGDEMATCHWDHIVKLTTEDGQSGFGYIERGLPLRRIKQELKREG